MVDAKDLKSFGRITHTGSSPVPGTSKTFMPDIRLSGFFDVFGKTLFLLLFFSLLRKNLPISGRLVLKLCLESGLLKEMEHVLLIDLYARLVKGVHFVKVSAHGARPFEEVEEIAKVKGVHAFAFEDDVIDLGVLAMSA